MFPGAEVVSSFRFIAGCLLLILVSLRGTLRSAATPDTFNHRHCRSEITFCAQGSEYGLEFSKLGNKSEPTCAPYGVFTPWRRLRNDLQFPQTQPLYRRSLDGLSVSRSGNPQVNSVQ